MSGQSDIVSLAKILFWILVAGLLLNLFLFIDCRYIDDKSSEECRERGYFQFLRDTVERAVPSANKEPQ